MNLAFRAEMAGGYKSASQRARVLSEHWLGSQGYCPGCGEGGLRPQPNNNQATDFLCGGCGEPFELKSQKPRVGPKLADGAHGAMMARLLGGTAPNLFVLRYDADRLEVRDLFVVPRQFLLPATIERRKPLPPTAKRAGWVGCNILLREMPEEGRVAVIRDGAVEDRAAVRRVWAKTLFLRQATPDARGWLAAVMALVDRLPGPEFDLAQLYAREDALRARFPGNGHIRAKIRQQLQVLRDEGYLVFLGAGRYRRA